MKSQEESENFRQVANEGLMENATFDKRLEGSQEAGHADTTGRSYPGSGNSKHKCLGAKLCGYQVNNGESEVTGVRGEVMGESNWSQAA